MTVKGVYAFHNEDAPRNNPYNTEGWVAYNLVSTIGKVKEAKDFAVSIHDVMPSGMPPEKKLHIHKTQETLYIVQSGRLSVNVEGTEYELGPNTSMWIPPGLKHGFTEILEHTRVIEVVTKPDFESFVSDSSLSEKPWYEEYPPPRPLIKV